ncbi:MAG: hypothetical protein ACYTG7_12335 [Planctomycetota bacterium]|jgi:hypothetical protein
MKYSMIIALLMPVLAITAITQPDTIAIPVGNPAIEESTVVDGAAPASAASPWTDLGHSLAGTNGREPVLTGSGPLTGGSTNQIDLTMALPNTTTYLVLGFTLVEQPFKGGVLVPYPDLIFAGLPVGPSGSFSLPFTWPTGVPAGTKVYVQHWIVDPGGPFGFSASNGLQAEGQ